MICCAFCLLFNQPVAYGSPDDTTKFQLRYTGVDLVAMIQNAAQHADFMSLSSCTEDSVLFDMRLTNEEPTGEKMLKYDAFEILQKCEVLFMPDSLTIYVSQKPDDEGYTLYVLEMKTESVKSYYVFYAINRKIKKISVVR